MSLCERPEFVVVCGDPGHGKDTFADWLVQLLGPGTHKIDDGRPLREMAVLLYGVDYQDTLTQEGKRKLVKTLKGMQPLRQVLGELGEAMEALYGQNFNPDQAMRFIEKLKANDPAACRFIFPSVRRDQPLYYRERGALILQVIRPDAPVSPYEFDRWNRDAAHITIINDGSLSQLQAVASFLVTLMQMGFGISETDQAVLRASEFTAFAT